MYDPSTNVWRWSVNDQPVFPYPPWGPGFPISPPNPANRILVYHTNRYNAEFRTVGDTQSHRYICKVPHFEKCSLNI